MKVYLIWNAYFVVDRYGECDSFRTINGVYMSLEKAKEKVKNSIAEKTFANFTDYIYLDPSKIMKEPVVEFNHNYDPVLSSWAYDIKYKDTDENDYHQIIYIREYEVV